MTNHPVLQGIGSSSEAGFPVLNLTELNALPVYLIRPPIIKNTQSLYDIFRPKMVLLMPSLIIIKNTK